MATISLRFDLPFSVRVDGTFDLKTDAEDFVVTLNTYYEPEPTMPGADLIQNVAIVDDEGSSISHTIVLANYTPKDPAAASDPAGFLNTLPATAIAITNALVAGLREAYGEFVIDYVYSAARLGPIQSSGAVNGTFDSLSGGITLQTPSRQGAEAVPFANFLRDGAHLSVERELYFDARRYLLRGNKRMALANLVISFEVGLASLLGGIASSRGDVVIENEINEATLAPLGQSYAKKTIGESLENRSFWGDDIVDAFIWIRTARNKILHKAQMTITVGSRTRNFNLVSELKSLFSEHDNLVRELTAATSRVISGQSAKK